MPSLEEFERKPMHMNHGSYKKSLLHLPRAPENATGEVILASLYRTIGFNIGEKDVTTEGVIFFERVKAGIKTNDSTHTGISRDQWNLILEKILESPKQPMQRKALQKKNFLQLTPLVPDAALYSFAARFTGSPWNPGALIKSIISYGCKNKDDFQNLWHDLFEALSVNDADDFWARLLYDEFRTWRDAKYSWNFEPDEGDNMPDRDDWMKYNFPAKRFVKDLRSIMRLKPYLTRRQWISLIESLLRLGAASHVLWVCDVNWQVWSLFQKALRGESLEFKEVSELIMPSNHYLWRYGELATSSLKRKTREYITGRVAINYTLFLLERLIKTQKIPEIDIKLDKVNDIFNLYRFLLDNKSSLGKDINQEATELLEKEPKLLASTGGITSNMFEFLRYSLGQRQTIDPEARNYDQGYWIAKKGTHRSAPWVLSAGPVSLLVAAYCCTNDSSAPKTIDEFRKYLGEYGISIKASVLITSGLSQDLRDLGIVIDSPDAEGGMVVLNPFKEVGDNT